MSWVTVGVAGAGMALGALENNEEQKQHSRMQRAQAEMTRYSPWTGMQGQILTPPKSIFGSMLQGGATGAMIGQGLAKGGGASAGMGSGGGAKPVAMNYRGSQWSNLA